jgi:lysophospholipase L1-like esterase
VTTVLTLTVLEPRLAPAVRILPLGDSITQGGYFNSASYRYPLWEQLQQAGYSNVDFVGSRTTVYNEGSGNPSLANYPNYYSSFDRDHDGYWGYRTDQVLPLVPSIAAAARPDVVMLMLGTNDLGQGGQAGVAPAAANLGLIIDRLRAVNPTVNVLLAEIIPIGPDASNAGSYYQTGSAWVSAFNTQVVALAAAKTTPQSPVVVVDQFTGFNTSTDLSPDGVHPSQAGESWIANNFFRALVPLFPAPQVASVTINNGAPQRSMVTALSVTFSTAVTFASTPTAAFTLTRSGGGSVAFTAAAFTGGGATVVTLSNFTGTEATSGSLNDGKYMLSVLAAQVTANGLHLDGNGDGTGGDDYTLTDNGKAGGLFRLYGDANGDRVVNQSDLSLFRVVFGATTVDKTFDVNGDGVIDAADLSVFRISFGNAL